MSKPESNRIDAETTNSPSRGAGARWTTASQWFSNLNRPPRQLSRRALLAVIGLGLLAPAASRAQYIYTPTGNQNGNWNVAARWTGGPSGTFPNAIDATATFNLPASTAPSGNYNVQLSNTAGQNITVGAITVNNSASATGSLRFGANGNGTLTFQTSAGPATYTENAASPTDSTFNSVIFAPVTFASDTVITQNHNLTNNSGTQFSSSGNSPGGVTAASNITLTKEGQGNVEFGVAPTAPGAGFQGSVIVNNGAVRQTDNVFANAAAVTVNNGGQFQLGSSTITNWALGTGAILTLNGSGKAAGSAAPEGALRFQNNAATASFDSAVQLATTSSVFVNANLAPTPPNPVTYGHLTLSQSVSGQGGLVKDGPGILTLSQGNTYGSDGTITEVKAGTLLVENATGSATGANGVQIDAGAALGGSGIISGPVTSLGGILSPGSSPGTLTIGSLILDAASTLAYELDTPGIVGSGVNDLTVVNGDLILAGTLNVLPLGGFGAGTYRLFDYTGALSNSGLVINGLPTNLVGALDTSLAGQVNLTVTAVPEPASIVLVLVGGLGIAIARGVGRRSSK